MNTPVDNNPDSATPVLETSDKKPRTIGIIVLIITFGIFGLWSVFAPLDSASNAPGVVGVKGKRKTIQHYEGGIVKDILVAGGDVVSAGQALLILEKTQFSGELGVLKGQFFNAKAIEQRLIAERDDKVSVLFPDSLSVDDERAKEAKRNQIQIFKARSSTRLGEVEVLKQRVAQLYSQIDGLNALVKSQIQLRESFKSEMDELSELLDEGFVEKTRVVELHRNFTRTQGQIADQQASIAETKVRIGETRLEILQLNKRFKTEVVDELAAAQAQVYDLKERMTVIEDRVARTVVKAPVAGKVMSLNAHTIGGVIQAGVPIMEIVPEHSELIIDAQLSPNDIDRVAPGLEAKIRFSSFKSKTTPVIEGRVTNVSADRLVDEVNGFPYYAATIAVTEEGQQKLKTLGLVLLPGMPAEVLIKTGERTMFQYLTGPARDAMARSLIEE